MEISGGAFLAILCGLIVLAIVGVSIVSIDDSDNRKSWWDD